MTSSDRSDGDDKLGVDVRKSGELGLIKVHDEQFIGRRQLGSFAGKLAIEVAYIFDGFLLITQNQSAMHTVRRSVQVDQYDCARLFFIIFYTQK